MSAEERRSQILDLTRAQGFVSVADLVARLAVSPMTIRRDLTVLAARGVLEKVHGGGTLPKRPADESVDGIPDGIPDYGPPPRQETDRWSPDAPDTSAHVGIVVPSGHYYFPLVVGGVRRVFDARAVRRSLAISGYDPAQERALVRQLLDAGSNGLLLAPSIALDEAAPERTGWLFDLPVPVVLLERTVRSSTDQSALCSVRTDHELGCVHAVHHLRRLGHRGVALVTQGVSQTKARVVDGWRQAVERAGLDPGLSPLVTTSPQANRERWPTNDAIDAVLDTLHAAQATATLVHSDQTALAMVQHARRRGWRIPQDMSVIAYDNAIAEMADPPLTAVSPPKDWTGQAAATLLLDLIATGSAGPVRHLVAEPELVVRTSTAEPRATPLPG